MRINSIENKISFFMYVIFSKSIKLLYFTKYLTKMLPFLFLLIKKLTLGFDISRFGFVFYLSSRSIIICIFFSYVKYLFASTNQNNK